MSCTRYTQSVTAACRDAQPGVAKVYLANFGDITSFDLDAAGTTVTGITMSGSTLFYPVAQNKESASMISTPTINNPNGVAIDRPKLSIRVQGLTTTTIQIYKELLQADVVAVIKTINGDLFAIGWNNGLSMSTGTIGTEAAADGFMGLTAELDGIEASPFYKIGTNVDFAALVVGGVL